MQYKIIVSDLAWDMLGAHVRFLAQVNTSAARKAQKRFVDAIKSLEKMPERYPFFDADYIPPGKYHKLYVENWYLILYQVRDNTVYVDYILDGRQDYSWLF